MEINSTERKRKHIVITGIGRAGTSYLMQLLTNLGLDTGFTPENSSLDENARAGLELSIKSENCPYIVKDTLLVFYSKEIFENPNIDIEHVFIPMRDLHGVVKSRQSVNKKVHSDLAWVERMKVRFAKDKPKLAATPGGLWNVPKGKRQEDFLLENFYGFILELSKTEVPVTLINYPKNTCDSLYLFGKLSPILNGIDYEHFSRVFDDTVNRKMVHSFSKDDT